ncbi:hypothetical protein [Streptomyces sp. NPDC092903]|uniref:hypothetical protein n=1 Tax=Streptomyces sp. NPDC092903 TaxID=3366017 RepID=UPI0038116ECE
MFTNRSINGVGIRLYPRGIATAGHSTEQSEVCSLNYGSSAQVVLEGAMDELQPAESRLPQKSAPDERVLQDL